MSEEVSATSGTDPTFGHVVKLGAEDRVVGRVVHVGGVRIERQLVLPRHAREVLALGRRRDLHARRRASLP